jgi:hypothetical protein
MPDDAQLPQGFRCRICRQWHDRLPLSYSAKVPQAVAAIPEWGLDSRVVFTLDQCFIDKSEFYMRGRIVVPVFPAGGAVHLGRMGAGRGAGFFPRERVMDNRRPRE